MKFGIREIVFLVVMGGLLSGTYFFVFSKNEAKRAARMASIASKNRDLAELKAATDKVNDVDQKIDELRKATAFFESKLPQAKEQDVILREVSQLAEGNNLQVRSIKTLRHQRMNGYSEQPIDLALSGDFNGFYTFLLQLEKLPRLTRLSQMKLSKIQSRDGEMEAVLTLSIFFEPDTDNAPAGGAATASAR